MNFYYLINIEKNCLASCAAHLLLGTWEVENQNLNLLLLKNATLKYFFAEKLVSTLFFSSFQFSAAADHLPHPRAAPQTCCPLTLVSRWAVTKLSPWGLAPAARVDTCPHWGPVILVKSVCCSINLQKFGFWRQSAQGIFMPSTSSIKHGAYAKWISPIYLAVMKPLCSS